MQNHYKTLGITNAASTAEIRRAYRVLARRYHPDVNPDGDAGELFKAIAIAYAILSDPEKKKQYDLELKESTQSINETFDRAHEALRKHQRNKAYTKQQSAVKKETKTQKAPTSAEPSPGKQPPTPNRKTSALAKLAGTRTMASKVIQAAVSRVSKGALSRAKLPKKTALIELSVSMLDAIKGSRRSVELPGAAGRSKKVSVSIPPGVRTGSVVTLRSKERPQEEIVLVIKVEHHPWLSLGERGLTMEVPLTVGEAIDGAKIQVPSLGDPLLVTVEPLTQSGKEVRLKGQGLPNRDGSRGDLYIRFVVKIPSEPLPEEIRSLTELLGEKYTTPVRHHLPTKILSES